MSKKKMITESKIIRFYVDEGLSGRKISEKTGYALTTIQKVLKKHNITRNLKEARVNLIKRGYNHPFRKKLDENKVINFYTKENISIPKIAKIFDCSLAPILRILKENKIPTKSPSESHKGNRGYWEGKKRPDISAKLKGIKRSKETREKLRLSHLGQKSTKKGKSYEEFYGVEKSEELKKKLVKSHLGIPSHRKGKSLEEEFGKRKAMKIKGKISQKSKEQFSSKESRKAQSERIKKFFKNNPEFRLRLSQIQKEYNKKYPERAKKHSEFMKRLYANPNKRKFLSENLKKFYKENPEALKRMSEIQKKIWSTPEKREYARQRRFKQKFPFKHTLPERLVFDEMQLRGIKFEKHKTVLNICQPDAVINNTKIAIFVDGDYWHAHPEKYKDKQLTNAQIDKVRRDKEQNEILKKDGWIILRFWETDIKKDVAKCINKIEEVMKLKK